MSVGILCLYILHMRQLLIGKLTPSVHLSGSQRTGEGFFTTFIPVCKCGVLQEQTFVWKFGNLVASGAFEGFFVARTFQPGRAAPTN